MQEEIAGPHADVAANIVGALQDCLPLADGDDRLWRGEREQLAEPPDAAEIERIAAIVPAGLELAERLWNGNAIPFVVHIEQSAAFRAGDVRLVDGISTSTARRNAGLIGDARGIGCGVNRAVLAEKINPKPE